LIEIGSKTAEKNSAQTNKQTDTTKIMAVNQNIKYKIKKRYNLTKKKYKLLQ